MYHTPRHMLSTMIADSTSPSSLPQRLRFMPTRSKMARSSSASPSRTQITNLKGRTSSVIIMKMNAASANNVTIIAIKYLSDTD